MNIKSLLLGSAAALAAVSGAQAADAIVAAEPEPMEYVRVCDAFGTGFFYIPGTETCLRISAEVRFAVNFGEDTIGGFTSPSSPFGTSNGEEWESRTRVRLRFDARTDTELGALQSYIELQGGETTGFSGGTGVSLRQGYVSIAGLSAGRMLNWWDDGIAGEADLTGTTAIFNGIRYAFTGDAFNVGIEVDDLTNASYSNRYFTFSGGSYADAGVGVSANATAKLGGASLQLTGGYDFQVDEGAVRLMASAEVGPGSLAAFGFYSSGPNVYQANSDWGVGAAYTFKATEQLSITPGVAYYNDLAFVGDLTGLDDNNAWDASLTVSYKPVTGLEILSNVEYVEDDVDGSDNWGGFVRLIRTF
jgi:hypothetical protein